MKFSFLVLFLLMACSTPAPEPTLVQDFMKERMELEYAEDKKYEEAYTQYLMSVHTFYVNESLEHKFPSYLNSIRNRSQLIAHADFNFPQRYRRETGRRAVERSAGYKAYKARFMRYLEAKIDKERVEKLKTEIGADKFLKLKSLPRQNFPI